jgi:hypothetical protein
MKRVQTKHCLAALIVAAACAIARIAGAECGDVDESGAVTVTDGVQVLRGAAGLSSLCTQALCDVDGSGGITVTDAVNVLRKAAGLTSNATCGSSVDQAVAAVIDDVRPLLEIGLGFIPVPASSGAKISWAAAAGQGFPCPDGGSIEATGTFTTFMQCTFGGETLNGTIGGSASTVDFSLNISDAASGDSISINGGLGFALTDKVITLNGNLAFSSTLDGSFGVAFQTLQVDASSSAGSLMLLGGALVTDVSSSGTGLQTITLRPNGTNVVAVDVDLTAGGTAAFTYDLQSGELTPA